MKSLKPYYPSKILLFGEYTVINGSSAIALPYNGFHAKWSQDYPFKQNKEIVRFLEFVLSQQDYFDFLNLEKFNSDIKEGWNIHCNIPIGYGLGSSGAICAAIYDRYSREASIEILELKRFLALLENYFHQDSSGIDPLVSYLDAPILIKEGSLSIQENITLNKINNKEGEWVLIDTQIERRTAPFVRVYNKKLHDDDFKEKFVHPMIAIVNSCISALCDNAPLNKLIQQLSILQYEYLQEMIIPEIKPLWLEGLNSHKFYLKLCGAGGGGMMLAFVNDMAYFNEKCKLPLIKL